MTKEKEQISIIAKESDLCDSCLRQGDCTIAAGRTASCAKFQPIGESDMSQPISSIKFASSNQQRKSRMRMRTNTDTDTDVFVSTALETGALVDDCNANRSAMLAAAINAARNAYCPYSHFRVGAALLTITANIYAGCNVENTSMSHAELTAITAAITAEGPDMLITEMVIWAPTPEPVWSCGGCRQLILEHAASNIWVWSFCDEPTVPGLGMTIDELLPHSFWPERLR